MAKQVGQKVMTGSHRNAVPIVVTTHDTHRGCFLDHPAKRVKVHLMHFTRGNMRISSCISVTASFWNAVDCVMLQGGGYSLLLNAQYHLFAELGDVEWIFTITFNNTSPALVSGYVQYRCVDIGIAEGLCLAPCNFSGMSYKSFIPGTAYIDRR